MALWFEIALYVAGFYLLAVLIMYFIQDVFFFHPEKLTTEFVFDYPEKFEEINLVGHKNSTINALLFPVEDSRGVIFYFKGNTRSNKGWAKFANDFTSKGYTFFMIDYPGFGKSTGKRDETTVYKNAQIAYLWLVDKYGEDQISIYGRSLGAGFATRIASWNNPRTLILDGPFTTFKDLCHYYTRILPLSLILKYRIPLKEYILDVKCPVFLIHGDKDRVIPYKFSVRLEKLNPKRIRLFTIKGAKHNNLPKFEEYHRWLDYALNDPDAILSDK